MLSQKVATFFLFSILSIIFFNSSSPLGNLKTPILGIICLKDLNAPDCIVFSALIIIGSLGNLFIKNMSASNQVAPVLYINLNLHRSLNGSTVCTASDVSIILFASFKLITGALELVCKLSAYNNKDLGNLNLPLKSMYKSIL